jgi:hypothetical protein
MRRSKFFSSLLAFFVLFATFPGGMVVAFQASEARSQETEKTAHDDALAAGLAVCHHGHDADSHSASHGRHEVSMDAQAAQHGDCSGMASSGFSSHEASEVASHDCFNGYGHDCSGADCASLLGCSGFAGLFSLMATSPVIPGLQEAIPFRASLRLDARATGIYHPPRHNA